MITTFAGPWLSPAVVIRNDCPNEFPAMIPAIVTAEESLVSRQNKSYRDLFIGA
jgi:hypothetical protein